MLNQIIINNIKTNEEIDALGNRDSIFNLIPYTTNETSLHMTKNQAMEVYRNIENIENIELYYLYLDDDQKVITVNPEYYELLSNDKGKKYPFAIIGYNINQRTDYLNKSEYEFMGKSFPIDEVFVKDYEFKGLINFEGNMNDFVFIVSDELFSEFDDNYEENFTNRVWQMKIILDDGEYDENYRYDYANDKSSTIRSILSDYDLDVNFLVSSITGIVRSNNSYSRDIWDNTQLETYSIIFLIVTIYMTEMIFTFRKRKYNYSVFLLNGLSVFKLTSIIVLINCLSYIFGVLIGAYICSFMQIEFTIDILNYFFIFGILINIVFVVSTMKITNLKNISICIRERSN